MKFLNWVFNSLSDETKGSMSLARLTYLIGFLVAVNKWNDGKEISQYFFYFLLINLLYLLFKYRAFDLMQNVLTTISNLKTIYSKGSSDAK